MIDKTILVLGGYGGAGKAIAKRISEMEHVSLIIGGRNFEECQKVQKEIEAKNPMVRISSLEVDASERDSVKVAFEQADLAIVAATIPDRMGEIVDIALETQTDLMDILMRGDVVDPLKFRLEKIKSAGIRVFTQCGFHPGMVAPMIRSLKSEFSDYQSAHFYMGMDGVFKHPESIHEILYEIISPTAQILENGIWRKANHKDARSFKFSLWFGDRLVYPLQMVETHRLNESLGLKDCGTFATGFSEYIDKTIFPLAYVLGKINKKISLAITGRLFYNHVKKNRNKSPKAELVLMARGYKETQRKSIELRLFSENALDLTGLAVSQMLREYLENKHPTGIHLMGEVIDENQLLNVLAENGVKIEIDRIE